MDTLQTAILSITQGITEILPISSSGHLILISEALDIKTSGIFLLTALHLGTLVPLLVKYWGHIIKNLNKDFVLKVVVASVPAALTGFFLNDYIETYIHNSVMIVNIIGTNLILWGLVMIAMELKPRPKASKDVGMRSALLVGLFQILALIPGTSRSAITTIGGVASGLRKDVALRFGFVIGIPIIAGAFFYELISTPSATAQLMEGGSILGIFITGVVGYIAITFLDKISSKKYFLTFFGVYRIVLGSALLLLF